MNKLFIQILILLVVLLAGSVVFADEFRNQEREIRDLARRQENRGEERRLHARTRRLIRRKLDNAPRQAIPAPQQKKATVQDLPPIVSKKFAKKTLKDAMKLKRDFSPEKEKAIMDKWQQLMEENSQIEKDTAEWDEYVKRVKAVQAETEAFEKAKLALIKKLEDDAEHTIKHKGHPEVSSDDEMNVLEAETEGWWSDAVNVGRNAVGGVVNGARQWGGEVVRDVRAIANVDNLRAAGRDIMDTARATGRTVMDAGRTAGSLIQGDRAGAQRNFASMERNAQQAVNAGTRVYNNPAVQGAIDLAHKGRQVYQAVQTGGTSLIAPALMAAGQGIAQGNTRYNGVPEFNRIQAPNVRDLAAQGMTGLANRAIGAGANYAMNRVGGMGGAAGRSIANGLTQMTNRLPQGMQNLAQRGIQQMNIPGRLQNWAGNQARDFVTQQGGRLRDWAGNQINNQINNGFQGLDTARNAINQFRQNPGQSMRNLASQGLNGLQNQVQQGFRNLPGAMSNLAQQGMRNGMNALTQRGAQWAGQQANRFGQQAGNFAQNRLNQWAGRLPQGMQNMARQGINNLNLGNRVGNWAQQQASGMARNFGGQMGQRAAQWAGQQGQRLGQGVANWGSQMANRGFNAAQNFVQNGRMPNFGQMARGGFNQMSQMANQMRQQAGQFGRQFGQQASQFGRQFGQQGGFNQMRQQASQFGRQFGQQAQQFGRQFGQQAQQWGNQLRQGAGNMMRNGWNQMQGQMRQGLNQLPGQFRNFAQQQVGRFGNMMTQRGSQWLGQQAQQLGNRFGNMAQNRLNQFAGRLPGPFAGMAQRGLQNLNLGNRLGSFAQQQAQRFGQRMGGMATQRAQQWAGNAANRFGQSVSRFGNNALNRVNNSFNRRPQQPSRPMQRPMQRPTQNRRPATPARRPNTYRAPAPRRPTPSRPSRPAYRAPSRPAYRAPSRPSYRAPSRPTSSRSSSSSSSRR